MGDLKEQNIQPAPRKKEYGESMHIFALLFRHKYFIGGFVLVAIIASVVISLNLPVQYESTVNVVPPQTSGSMLEGALGNVSSALKNIGLTQLGAGEGTYSFLVILMSRSLQDSLIQRFDLPERYDIPDTMMMAVRGELTDNMDITLEKQGNYTITIWDENPDTAAAIANAAVHYANSIATTVFRKEARTNRIYLEKREQRIDSLLTVLSDSLKEFSRKHKLYSPLDQASAISQAFADLKAKTMEYEIYYELFKANYGENDPATRMQKKLLEEMRAQMQDATDKPGFAGDFTLNEAADVGIEYIRLFAEFETMTQVKSILMPMIEQSRLEESKEKFSLYLVDGAVPAEKKSRPKRSLIVIGSAFGAFIISILIIFLIDGYRNFRKRYKEYSENR